jgi:hypothetical protein
VRITGSLALIPRGFSTRSLKATSNGCSLNRSTSSPSNPYPEFE